MAEKKHAELLAPAGSYESMTAAVCAGADAVYLGGRLFGARAYADNLDTEHLKQAIDYVHIHGKALYLTVNTLLKEQELAEQLYHYIKPLYEQGLDAVIVQDMGVLSLIREYFPDLPIHASTQMSITGANGAGLLKRLGVKRIVTARELSLEEIADIHDRVDIEIESFIHGALCYCYSGQCLFSSIAGGRSGNRGRCAQPCRLPYTCKGRQQYYLSPRDLCTLGLLPELLRAGVYSLKIEGRMKKPEYTAGTVSIYRKYLDRCLAGEKNYHTEPGDERILFDIYNRGGFTEGYYRQHNGKDMMFLEGREGGGPEKNEALFKQLRRDYIETEKKETISGAVTVHAGSPVSLSIRHGRSQVQVSGCTAVRAEKQPLDKERIQRQVGKLGNTPFVWEELLVDTDGESFLPVTELNELRRSAVDSLMKEILAPYRRRELPEGLPENASWREEREKNVVQKHIPRLHVYLEKTEYAPALLSFPEIDAMYLDCCVYGIEELAKLTEMPSQAGAEKPELFYVLPHIFRKKDERWLDRIYDRLLVSGITGFVVKNYDEIGYLKERKCPLKLCCDYTVYTFNSRAKKELAACADFEFFTLPVELNRRELSWLSSADSELIVYGRIPMMVSAQCTMKNTGACTGVPGVLTLTDRYRNDFPIKNQCSFCYNKIYNCKPLSLLSCAKEAAELWPGAVRLDFTTESAAEAMQIAERFINAYKKGIHCQEEPWEFTRGHFKRGIE